jgi:hypothetical protein
MQKTRDFCRQPLQISYLKIRKYIWHFLPRRPHTRHKRPHTWRDGTRMSTRFRGWLVTWSKHARFAFSEFASKTHLLKSIYATCAVCMLEKSSKQIRWHDNYLRSQTAAVDTLYTYPVIKFHFPCNYFFSKVSSQVVWWNKPKEKYIFL